MMKKLFPFSDNTFSLLAILINAMYKLRFLFYLFALIFFQAGFAFPPSDFSQENATKLLYHISEIIGPRPMGSPAEQDGLAFATKKFIAYGCDTAYIMPMTRTSRANTNSGIAVGIKRGTTNRIILIGGHMDSVTPEVPGTDDDGSGSACVIELARVFGLRDNSSTLVFCCFGGEEEGLEGSQYFVDHFPLVNDIVLMLQIDMANGLGIIDIDGETHGASAPQWLMQAGIEEFYKLGFDNLRYPTHFFALNYSLAAGGGGSDHEPFLDKGIPAIDFTSDVSNPMHTPQDRWKNFDQRGLLRSGLVVQKIIERFDNGVPSEKTTQYWLYQIGKRFFFIPLAALWVFVIGALLLSCIAYVTLRNREKLSYDILLTNEIDFTQKNKTNRFSFLKMIALSLIIVATAWLLPDVLVLIKGVRYPWYAHIPEYFLLCFASASLGTWLVLQWTPKLRLHPNALPYFRIAAGMLFLFTGLASLLSVKLALYPAWMLFLLSIVVFIRSSIGKILLVLLGHIWMLRSIFSEWFEFIARMTSAIGNNISSFSSIVIANSVAIILCTLISLPFLFGLATIYRDAKILELLVEKFRSLKTGLALAVCFIAVLFWLASLPSYTSRLVAHVHIEQNFDLKNKKQTHTIHSSDFLNNVILHYDNRDTLFSGQINSFDLPVRAPLQTSWVRIQRTKEILKKNDTTNFHLSILVSSLKRPYHIEIDFYGSENGFRNIATPLKYTSKKNKLSFSFYSFPDTSVTLPVSFQTVGCDSVTENASVTFSEPFLPITPERENTAFIFRSHFTEETVYKP
jgi:hypothetical protein